MQAGIGLQRVEAWVLAKPSQELSPVAYFCPKVDKMCGMGTPPGCDCLEKLLIFPKTAKNQ